MVFDQYVQPSEAFSDRNAKLGTWFQLNNPRRVVHVQQVIINDQEELLNYEAECLSQGWEGVMVRNFSGYYKQGRSTVREGILLKLKRFFDDEAVVVSAHELVSNQNEATTNALGYTERSSHKANMLGMGILGKFTVKWKDVEFDIGTGFDANMRDKYWREDMTGKTLTFKYQSLGPNGKPRFPVFLGFRNDT
jgi:DNA ligase-1